MTEVSVDHVRVGHPETAPPLDGVTVYASRRTTLLDAEFRFDVIGVSHHVSAPALGFHELATCVESPAAALRPLPLSPDLDERLRFETGSVAGVTEVWTVPGVDVSGAVDPGTTPDDADGRRSQPGREPAVTVAHTFAPDAHTVVTVADTRADATARYETYHTYPELDRTVRTATRLRRTGP